MILRFLQVLAACLMGALTLKHLSDNGYFIGVEAYWREVMFAGVGVLAGWLLAVTKALRPVVAIFAAFAFFLVAKLDEPSGASLVAALDDIGSRVLAAADRFTQG